MSELYIGLISGTSADGVDAALVDMENKKINLVATHFTPYEETLRRKVLALYQPSNNEIQKLGELEVVLGNVFAQTANELLQKNNLFYGDIIAIGSHGQTVRHHPDLGFTLQLADPNIIAAQTAITTVADFRRRDLAVGGQGAPLVPAFHQAMFASHQVDRAIVNIGGIANITLLPVNQRETVKGFDTGPGNVLLDEWMEKNTGKNCDEKGSWAASGQINAHLLEKLLADPYFKKPTPKSTGREYFNLAWLEKNLLADIAAVDVQTTLVELTALTIIQAIQNYFMGGEIFVCGGGAHNEYLMSRLKFHAQNFYIGTTSQFGINPDWVEAMAFAWLAQQTLAKKPGNLPAVTGAKKPVLLGGVYYA